MINLRIIARAFSQILILEGLAMLLTTGVSWLYREPEAQSFLYSALITIVTGILVFTPLRNEEKVYGQREGFIITTGIWIIFSLFSTLPFLFSRVVISFPDAFFESISGYTTTGATIFRDVESLPKGILFWRSITQWLGGVAIIMLSLYVVPVIKTLNIQLSTTEFSGMLENKIHPRIIEAAKRLVTIYVVLTFTEVLILFALRMPFFDAVCHSLSTLSTGGFSTRNAGIQAFTSPYIKVVITIFMFLAGINPALAYHALKGHFRKIIVNNEFVFYTLLAIGFSVIVSGILILETNVSGKPIMDGFFTVISIMSTTGFYVTDYNQWGYLLILLIFILMFTGGMAGSPSGGIKIIRLLIIVKNNRKEVRKIIHPNAWLPVWVDEKKVPVNIIHNLLIFITLYFVTLCSSTLIISFFDYDIVTSFSTAASMLGNIGPGIGTFGPFRNYADLPVACKWILSLFMLVGRLELLTVIVLFTRSFYKR